MKFTCRTEYALKALADLAAAFPGGEAVPLSAVARRQGIPLPFLEQIMLALKHAGYVASRRGKGGGYFLARPPRQITLGEIIRLLDGPLQPVSCGACGQEVDGGEPCAFREVWQQVAEAVAGVVDGATFQDILRRGGELRRRGSAYIYHI
ncbi:MAG: RrF2 family transcriptional regulator [Spirochaetota bacterium]